MFQEIVLLTVSIIIYTLIYHYKREISQKYNLIDLPNEKRKIHTSPTPIIGGLIIIIIFFLNMFVYFFLNLTNDLIIILSLSLIFFLVGLIDDIKNLSSYFRLIFLFLVCYLGLSFSDHLIIKELNFNYNNINFNLGYSSIFITSLTLLLLVNALNLADGINGLSTMLLIFWIIYIKFFLFADFSLSGISLLLIILIIFYHIYQGKYFMGDSGVTASALIIGLLSINSYNVQVTKNIYVEELFLLFFIPGLDMFRLFLQRIYNKKNPFVSDNQHLHHLLIKKYKLSHCLIFYFIISFLPLLIYKNFNVNTLYLILSYTLLYLIMINFFLKKIPHQLT
jgi:UDP-GlcNAc:undecaprenyl-phosphate GlcNAc-1-phosphate transferase